MCGIVGLIGDITAPRHSQVFRNMLFLDQVRGHHSTGVVAVTDKYVRMDKEVGGPTNLFTKTSPVFDADGDLPMWKDEQYQVLIGHNRHATVGGVNKANAHPFKYKHIYGVHNGTLRTYDALKLGHNFSSDSQYLINAIAEIGIDEVWKNFHGAAAVVYYDNQNATISIIRNHERPMFLTTCKWQDLIAFSSESWMSRAALARSKMEAEGESKEVPVNTLLTFSVENKKPTLVDERVLKVKEYPTFFPVSYQKPSAVLPDEKRGEADAKLRELNKGWAIGTNTCDDIDIDSTLVVTNVTWCDPSKVLTEDGLKFIVCKLEGDWKYVNVYPTTLEQMERLFNLTPHISKLRVKKRVRMVNGRQGSYRLHVNHTRVIVRTPTIPADNVVALPPPTPNQVMPEKMYKGFGGYYAKPFYEKLLDNLATPGCCDYCNKTFEEKDYNHICWLSHDSALCDECVKKPEFAEYIHVNNTVKSLH